MNIAITVWGNRISPVFDAAQTLLIVEIDDGQIIGQQLVSIERRPFERFQNLLQSMGVTILICGAICEMGLKRLELAGVEVVPFLTGEVGKLLEQFARGEEFTDFAMPGCRIGGCCRTRAEGRMRPGGGKVDGESIETTGGLLCRD